MKLYSLLALSAISFLSGCATYSEQKTQTECLTKDWYAFGYDTAKAGRTRDNDWNELDAKCAEHNLWTDLASFNQGYDLALKSFCTEINGFEFGKRNKGYSSICSEDEQDLFDAAYLDGEQLYNANENLETSMSNLDVTYENIANKKARRKYLANLIDSGTLEDSDEGDYVKERYRLKSEIYAEEQDIGKYQSKIKKHSRRVAELEQVFSEKYYRYESLDEDEKTRAYSYNNNVHTKEIILEEPAILLIQPGGMDRQLKRHYKKLAKAITEHISATQNRTFRYQVVRNVQLVIPVENQDAIKYHTSSDFYTPTLLMWDGSSAPTMVAMPLEMEEAPVQQMDNFTRSL